jgi:hypothetical protein
MRIVNREQLLKLAIGTIYQDYKPHTFGPLSVFRGPTGYRDDFWLNSFGDTALDFDDPGHLFEMIDGMIKRDESHPVDLETNMRDGGHIPGATPHVLYAIWEEDDLSKLQDLIKSAFLAGINSEKE